MAKYLLCVLTFLLSLAGVQAIQTYYMMNDCGNTIYISYDEQIRVNLTSSSYYSNNVDCNVTFETSPGNRLKIYVRYIDTERGYDWLELYNGYYLNHNSSLGLFQGQDIFNNTSIYTYSNILTAKFVSGASYVYTGFEVILTPYHTGFCRYYEHTCPSSGRCVSQTVLGGQCDPCLDSWDCGHPLRLIGPTSYEGRLEVYHAGSWGTVCDDSFDVADAIVVCRNLGFDWDLDNVTFHTSAFYGPGSGRIVLDDLSCTGNETKIDQCNHNKWLVNNCGHDEDVGVNCGLPVRLVDGNSSSSGRLEVYTNSSWNTVCYSYFSEYNARAVCSMFGLGRFNLPQLYTSSMYGHGSGTISELIWSCNYNSDDLLKCNKRLRYSYEFCYYNSDVGIDCGPPYRLVHKSGSYKGGLLEIYNGHSWERVCYSRFHTDDASVVCRALGFSRYVNISNNVQGITGYAINDQMWSCNGYESDLEECYHYTDYSHSCNHYNDVSLECGTDIRLVNGPHQGAGRVEVYHDGQWGTICDDNIIHNSATVICRMLGYNATSAVARTDAYYGYGTGPIMIDDFHCTGRETSIVDCMRAAWYQHDCGHYEDAGVDCDRYMYNTTSSQTTTTATSTYSNVQIRLVNGTGPSNGRLEVYYQGQWGTVCDDSFDSDDAHIVCRMLGYNYYRYPMYHPSAYYGVGSGSIIIDELRCSGYETSIVNCASNTWLSHDCSHSEDVGVDCYRQNTNYSATSTTAWTPRTTPTTSKYSNVQIRLVDGTGFSNGRLEVYYQGQWGTVCDDSFDSDDARVVCRMLGYNYYSHPMFHPQAYYGEGNGSIIIDDLQCNGYETSIVNCASRTWMSHNCGHNEDVGVDCSRNYYTTATTNYVTMPYVTTQSYFRLENAIRVGCNEYGWDIRVDMNMLRREYPNIRASDIYLGKNLCTGLDYGSSLLFHQGLRECLTSETISGQEIIYRNELVYAIHDRNNPFIIRRYNWTVEVECDVSRNQTTNGHLHHDAHNGTSHHVSGSSNYTVHMSFYRDPNFLTPLTGNPFHVAVGTKVYVKVYTTANDWNVKMVVHDCYTKPSSTSPDHTKYAIITNGCEIDTNTHIISQSTHETKFVFEDFEYTTNHEGIYLFCDATFCSSSDYSRHCQQMCHSNTIG